jgi:murein DD-endopeptidase MepM/ murein hydrolase activator NlpD
MDFIPLPSFINFKNKTELENMFTPYSYAKVAANGETTIGPSFVCVYLGQRSQHLDYSDSNFKNDGFNFGIKEQIGDVPADFHSDFNDKTTDSVPVFVVNYGSENQSIFQDVALDQQEFTETDEGLRIIDDIANRASATNKSFIGQNLFNLYSVRSYSCEVQCLGNAMIQPMMYFQLNNIPLFRGAYWIINTSHSITPNHMTTKFKGVRIRKPETPLLDASTVFMNFLGSIDSATSSAKLTGVFGGTTVSPTVKDDEWVKDGEMSPATVTALGALFPVDSSFKIGSPIGLRGNTSTDPHYGVDIYVPVNNGVFAIAKGTVSAIGIQYADDGSGFGLYVMTKHVVNGETIMTMNAHLNSIDNKILTAAGVTSYNQLEKKQIAVPNYNIEQGDLIAKTGGDPTKTARTSGNVPFCGGSKGPHLHFEIRTVGSGGYYDIAPLRDSKNRKSFYVDGILRQRDPNNSNKPFATTIVNDPVQVIQQQATYTVADPNATPSNYVLALPKDVKPYKPKFDVTQILYSPSNNNTAPVTTPLGPFIP